MLLVLFVFGALGSGSTPLGGVYGLYWMKLLRKKYAFSMPI